MTSRVLLGTNQPPTIEEQNVAKEGDFDWLDEDGDLDLHWDDEVDDVNVKNTDELVKWREIEISTSVGEDFSEAISDVLNQIDLEGEKDFVESEDELKSIGSSSDIEGENSLLVYKEGDEKKHGFHYKVGMIFNSNSQFKWAVEVHEAVNNKSIKFTKNDKRRVQAKYRVNHCIITLMAGH
nr:Zinc knuckle family protein [Ipomoea batatas]